MSVKTAFFQLCQRQSSCNNNTNNLASIGYQLVRASAITAAILLVFASAGLGAVFAAQQGAQHGRLVAFLTVCMGLGLELTKPLAIHGAFSALGSWRLGRGVALMLLGSLAVAYSLTAEITLISSNRSDLISKRSSEAYVANATKDSYEAAKRELLTMPANLRTVAELNIILESARRNPQAYKGCTAINGSLGVSCPKISAELAKSRRKEQLEAILSRQAEKLEHAPTVSIDDPGSAAIKTYLAALGIDVASSIISQWLNLVPVIALELVFCH